MPSPAFPVVLLVGVLLAADIPVAAVSVTADHGVAAGGDIRDNIITIGATPEQVEVLVRASNEALRTTYEIQVKELKTQLKVTEGALTGFFQIIRKQNVPPEKFPDMLAITAKRFREMQDRLAALNPDDPTTKALIEKARAALNVGHYDIADALLSQAEVAEQAAVRQAEQLVRDARAVVDRHWLNAAVARAERGELSMTRFNYQEAAKHFQAATEKTPTFALTARRMYRRRWADALSNYGDQKGYNDMLSQAIDLYHQALTDLPNDRASLDWAIIQNNLGNALQALGERERSTTRLKEAVTAYQSALEVRTRDRVPLDWATTQHNLGAALQILSEREMNPVLLKKAKTAYQSALEVRTRDRVPLPLDWAATQHNLGSAVETLGTWEANPARLREAITIYRTALEVRTRDNVPLAWAKTQNSVGNVLLRLGSLETDTAQIKEAVAIYRIALEVRTRDSVPLLWATTQNNLGVALAMLGERDADTARLEEAVAAHRAALEERTHERVPLDWAQTQRNLARAYRALKEEAKAEAICQELRDADLGYQCD